MPYVASSIAHIHDVAAPSKPIQTATANISESYTISDTVSGKTSAFRSMSESTSISDTLNYQRNTFRTISEFIPDILIDYSSTTGWTHFDPNSQNTIQVNGASFPGILKFNGTSGAGGRSSSYEWEVYDLGLIKSNFTIKFDYQWQSSSLSGATPVLLITDGTGAHPDLATNLVYIFHGLLDISPFTGNGFELNRDTSNGAISLASFQNTTVYVTLTGNISNNTSTLSVYSDSARTTQIGSTVTSTATTLSNLRYLYHANSHNAGSARNLTAFIDNFDMSVISNPIIISDSLVGLRLQGRAISESISPISDSLSSNSSFLRTLSDSFSLSDTLTASRGAFRSLVESYTISDILTSFVSIKRSIVEASYSIIDSLDAVVHRAVKVVTGGGAYTPISKKRVQGIQTDKFNNITIKVYIKDKKINPFVLYQGLTNNIETGVKLRVISTSDISNLISMASKLSSKLESLPNIKVPTSIVNFTDTMVKSILKTLNLDDLVIKTKDEQRKLDFVTLKTKTENKSEKDINMASILDNIEDINDTEKIE